jgi:hypothetical protein
MTLLSRADAAERMSSILLLPRHALSTCFSRLFGASIGLLMATKVKWYINSRGNDQKVFAFVSIKCLLYCVYFFLKPKLFHVVSLFHFKTTESEYSIIVHYYEFKLISSYLRFGVLSHGGEDVSCGLLGCDAV